jgi:hypothetical protein
MFGMSFGKSAPEPSRREEIATNQEVVDSLIESGLIKDQQALTNEEYAAVKTRADIIESSAHLNADVAIALAYIDRVVAREKAAGNNPEGVISKVSTEIVSAVVSPSLATNEEFLQTVLNTSKLHFLNGTSDTFSDALLQAVREREDSFANIPEIDGKIDGQDNVVLPSDEQLLR